MVTSMSLSLSLDAAQQGRIQALQLEFARACNAISPVVQAQRCWNRVALHHLVYKQIRADFPALGSQMACNVIYSVCRTARLVYSHPKSPWAVGSGADPSAVPALPLLKFSDSFPVFFDRHTLSLRQSQLSLFTLDGRMRFYIELGEAARDRFNTHKLKEIVLKQQANGVYVLEFFLGLHNDPPPPAFAADLPQYLVLNDDKKSPHAVLVAACAASEPKIERRNEAT